MEKINLYVMEDVLSPTPAIKQCRDGEEKFKYATELANRLKENAVLVNSDEMGETFRIEFTE